MRNLALGLSGLIVLITTYFLLWPSRVDPVFREPSGDPGLAGPYTPNRYLAAVDRLAPTGEGPEDVTMGPDGLLYTGVQDGRVVRFAPSSEAVETFIDTGGRPLGLGFDTEGRLIVADAFRGLLAASPAGEIEVLVDEIEGRKMMFTDDLDLAPDGSIWFSDASQRFDQHHWNLDFLEARATGRLLRFDPASSNVSVALDGLAFANGVALGPNEEYVLVNETMAARITRLWLKGPRAGENEVFVDELPGYPDNLSYNGDGLFWVAFPSLRLPQLERLWPQPFLREVLGRVPPSLLGLEPVLHSLVLAIDERGRVVHNLQDPEGGYAPITSANQRGSWLYLGSLEMPAVGRIAVPERGPSG